MTHVGWRRHDEVGAASVVQTVIVAPALLLMLMVIVQFALFEHAQSVAEDAAQQGAEVARRFDGSEATAHDEAERYLTALGPKMLTSHSITVRRTQQQATVTITGRVISLVPGIHLRIRETSVGPTERYVPPTEEN